MKGWKTWAAALGMIFTGLAQIANAVINEGDASVNSGIELILAGLALIGIGHKIEKSSLR